MTNARPNALSLAVAITISSFVINTQVLADRRLQTKSIDIPNSGNVEFTHSEVIVKPTLGHDQQPISKSFTTTYPDLTSAREGYDVPSEGFTDVLAGISGGASSIDQFETDENDFAQKYTKVLKVGDEGVFRFTHNLADKKLIIEVRKGMTDQDSIEAVVAQSGILQPQPLEPLTKAASPEQLAGILNGANKRAGNLGEADNFVALATVEVDEVEVNGRTFMRLIAAGDQPPELQILGQSLFVNDEALFAAATSAYTQVHVQGDSLPQEALNKLLSHQKPVGYVVYMEDDTQAYPVPAGYPTMEVRQAPGETIVFHGQKQNPADVAFVKCLHSLLQENDANIPSPAFKTLLKKDKVKSYQYVIRSRQMALLEELAVQHHAVLGKDKLISLANYEFLQQALTSATLPQAGEFEFTSGHIKVTSSIVTPTWMHYQLTKHFSFRPILRDLLTNQYFVQNFLNLMPIADELRTDVSYSDKPFASKVISDMARQLVERENTLEELLAKEYELIRVRNQLKLKSEKAAISEREKHIALQFKQLADNELDQLLYAMEEQQNQLRKVREEVARIPELEQEVSNVRAEATKARNTQLAAELGIDDWDDTRPLEEQTRLISKKINEINQSITAGQPEGDSVETTLAAVERQVGQQHLSQQSTRTIHRGLHTHPGLKKEWENIKTPGYPKTRPEVLKTLSAVEKALEMRGPDQDADVYLRRQCISEGMQEYIRDARWRAEVKARNILEIIEQTLNFKLNEEDVRTTRISDARQQAQEDPLSVRKALEEMHNIKVNKEDGITTRLNRVFILLNNVDLSNETLDEMLDEVDSILWAYESKTLDEKDVKHIRLLAHLEYKLENPDPDKPAREQQSNLLEAVENILNIKFNEENDKAARFARIRAVFESEEVSEETQNKIDQTLWKDESKALNERDLKVRKLGAILNCKVEESNLVKQAREKQASLLAAIEDKLNIDIGKIPAAKERSKAFAVKLAKDLNVVLEQDDDLASLKLPLKIKIQELIEKLDTVYDDEAARKVWNNELAHQLNIEGYKEDATIDHQNSLIEEKLRQLDKAVLNAGTPDINERITAIENELDRQMVDLGPKPRFILDREVTITRRAIQKAESELTSAKRQLKDLRRKPLVFESGLTDLHSISDEDNRAPGQAIKPVQTGLGLTAADEQTPEERVEDTKKPDSAGSCEDRVNALRNRQAQLGVNDGTGGKIQQLNQQQARLEGEIKAREADIERMKEDLKAAEQAVENDGSPFQFTPKQVKVLTDMHDFMMQHTLKKQALEAAIGLTELAIENNNGTPFLITFFHAFDFDNELAPFQLRGLVGEPLTFDQACRIVKVFRRLTTTFPTPTLTSEPVEHKPVEVLAQVEMLVYKARYELQNGAQEYDKVINSMGKTAIHFVEHEPEDLQGFSEYSASLDATGNWIIALLRQGLISRIELENYMKAVRGDDGYQTVDEFEHFLGSKLGVNLPYFKAVVQMLSDKDFEEFIENAIAPLTSAASGPAGMKESVDGMKEYAAAVIANYVLDDIAFGNGRRVTAFLTNVQDTLTPYANAVGLSESDLIKAIHNTLMQAHTAAVEHQLTDYWVKPSAYLVQPVIWYFISYKPLLVTLTALEAAELHQINISFFYLLDLTNRGDYLHRLLIPIQHWLEHYGVDLDRTGQYAYHRKIEQISEMGGLAMPLGKAASSVILLRTGSMLFTRQYNANPRSYRSISRLVPEIVKSMGSGQGVQVPLLNRVTPQKVKTLASATAGLVLGPIATAGAYAHGLIYGFTYAQTLGFALASSLTFDFFMNDNKLLTQWLGGPLGRSLDRVNRWIHRGETQDEYVKRTTIATPQRFNETDEEYARRVKAGNRMYGWTRHENYLQFRERRDRTMTLFENSWEKYFRENVPKWSFSHAASFPYSYTLGAFFEWRHGDNKKASMPVVKVRRFTLIR